MKKLSKLEAILYLVGGLLMVLGAAGFVFMFHQEIVCWIFLLGAILFTAIQSMQTYQGRNVVITRLKKIMNLASLLFVFSGILMVDNAYHFLMPLFKSHSDNGYVLYLTYVYNKWVLLLIIASILEIYATHRIDSELRREATNNKNL